jgi:GLPGLI family protein
MKKIFLVLFAFSLVLMSYSATPPKGFKGVITYKITYDGDDINEQMLSFLPKTMISYFRGAMSRTDLIMGMGKTIKIKNGDEKSVISLFDMMGQKVGYKADYEKVIEELKGEPEADIEIRDETKEIAGYECKRAVIETKSPDGEKMRMNAWFTEELGEYNNYFDTPEFKDINGILLEFEMKTPQFTMIFTAATVEKKNVSKKEFEVPDDYEMKSEEEIEAMFGGGM